MELTTEILIIGGGASGMAAAVAAAELGAEVTVAEANAAVGGNGLFPRGIFGVDQVKVMNSIMRLARLSSMIF